MKKIYLLLLLLLAGILTAACDSGDNGNSGPAALSTVNLGKGYESSTGQVTNPTVAFSPTDTFHCVIELTSAPAGTVVRTVWTTVNAKDASGNEIKDTLLEEVTSTPQNGNRFIDASPAPKTPWPVGKYKVEIFLNNVSVRTLNFLVN